MKVLMPSLLCVQVLARPLAGKAPRRGGLFGLVLTVTLAGQVALPVCGWAQSVVPSGGEYSIAGELPGDQMAGTLAVGAQGGYLAWQDNFVDRQNLGVGAALLGPGLTPVLAGFPINQITSGVQELPQVARLVGGGAVFVWQGGGLGRPAIYARMMSSGGAFAGPDIKVSRSSFTATNRVSTNWLGFNNGVIAWMPFSFNEVVTQFRESARDPAVAVLRDGSVVVVYSAFRKTWTTSASLVTGYRRFNGVDVLHSYAQPASSFADTMQDVFIRRLSATGQFLGEEVLANSSTTHNQRAPAVAALNNGNFVVVWVSEKKVAESAGQDTKVLIMGRVFDALGRPVGYDFRVNAEKTWCAMPAVSPLGEDGFTATWTQMNSLTGSGWDVYARAFNGAGPATAAYRVNTTLPGKQIGSKIATVGVNQLVVWTSLDQDGSQEGVFARLLSGGTVSGPEFLVNTRTASRQVQPTVAGDAEGRRFVVAWSSFTSGARGFDLKAQIYHTTQPPAPVAAPTVMALGPSTLRVSWPAAPYANLLRYELYIDGGTSPLETTNTVWIIEGLMPSSTHEFRVAYVLGDGQRSAQSGPGFGTTSGKESLLTASLPELGYSGADETPDVAAGDPTGSAGALRLSLDVTPMGRKLHWTTAAGGVYQVQGSTNLGAWTDLGAPRVAAAGGDSLDVTNHQSAAFFRVIRLR